MYSLCSSLIAPKSVKTLKPQFKMNPCHYKTKDHVTRILKTDAQAHCSCRCVYVCVGASDNDSCALSCVQVWRWPHALTDKAHSVSVIGIDAVPFRKALGEKVGKALMKVTENN